MAMMQIEFKNGSYIQVNRTAEEILGAVQARGETAVWAIVDGHLIQPGEIVCVRNLGEA